MNIFGLREKERQFMNPKIRKAKEKDLDKIIDLLHQVCLVHHEGRKDIFKIGTKYSKEELEEMIKDDLNPIFVYTNETDQALAYMMCNTKKEINNPILTDIKTLYIDDLCVDKAYRGMGIGKKLYFYAKEYAKENGYYNITLNVWELNPLAKGFYESLGLKPLKTYMEEIIK